KRSKFVVARAFAGSLMRASKRRNSSPRQLKVASTSTLVVTSNTLESERVRDTTIACWNSTCMSLASARRAAEKASHPVIAHAPSCDAVQTAAATAKTVDRSRILTPSALVLESVRPATLIFVGVGHKTIQKANSPARTPGLIDVRGRRAHRRPRDVDMRPRSLFYESLQELRCGDRAAVAAAGILHVGELGVDQLVVSRAEGHAPDLLARRLASGGEPFGKFVVVGEEPGNLMPERNHDGAGQRGEVDDRPRGMCLLSVPERVGQHEPSLGVRIDNLDRLSRHRRDDVAWPDRVPIRHVFNEADDA